MGRQFQVDNPKTSARCVSGNATGFEPVTTRVIFDNPFPAARETGEESDRERALPFELRLAKHKNEIIKPPFRLVNSITYFFAKIILWLYLT